MKIISLTNIVQNKTLFLFAIIFFIVYGSFAYGFNINNQVDSVEVYSYLEKAKMNFNKGKKDSAIYFSNKALAIAKKQNYLKYKISSLDLLAQIYNMQSNYSKGLLYYLQEQDAINEKGDRVNISEINKKIGLLYKRVNLHEKALEYLKVSYDIEKELKDKNSQVEILEYIADSYLVLERYSEALKIYKLILTLNEKSNVYVLISNYRDVVSCYIKLKEYDNSIIYNKKIFDLYLSTNDTKGVIVTLNNLGFNYTYLKDYENALKHFKQALTLERQQKTDKKQIASTLINIGVTYNNYNNNRLALRYLNDARVIVEKYGSESDLIDIYDLLSNMYMNSNILTYARKYALKSIELAEKTKSPKYLQASYKTLSEAFQNLYDYKNALVYYKKYLEIKDSLLLDNKIQQQELLNQQLLNEKAEKKIKLFIVDEKIKDIELRELKLKAEKKGKQLALLRKEKEFQRVELLNKKLEHKKTLQGLLIAKNQLQSEKVAKQLKNLKHREELQDLKLKEQEAEKNEADKSLQLLRKNKELADLEIEKQKTFKTFSYGIIALFIIIIILILVGFITAKNARKKSDTLLLNILPLSTANELKEYGKASVHKYTMVSVLFADIKGFTSIAESLSPTELIAELDYCFKHFDDIVDKYGIEKIKTIGDAYMCAGGVPEKNTTNPIDTVSAALEIQDFMLKLKNEKIKKGLPFWELRLGIHTGAVVAGVVGKHKFAYDIWGDAVNIASRMESSGEIGKVNVSGETYRYIKDTFKCDYRGKVPAKNKGEIDMYFVNKKSS